VRGIERDHCGKETAERNDVSGSTRATPASRIGRQRRSRGRAKPRGDGVEFLRPSRDRPAGGASAHTVVRACEHQGIINSMGIHDRGARRFHSIRGAGPSWKWGLGVGVGTTRDIRFRPRELRDDLQATPL